MLSTSACQALFWSFGMYLCLRKLKIPALLEPVCCTVLCLVAGCVSDSVRHGYSTGKNNWSGLCALTPLGDLYSSLKSEKGERRSYFIF